MKQTWKQIGSMLLALCMVLTMLPMTAFAETNTTDSDTPLGNIGEIIAFAALDTDVAAQSEEVDPAGDITTAEQLKIALESETDSTVTVSESFTLNDAVEVKADHALIIDNGVTLTIGNLLSSDATLTVSDKKTLTVSGGGTLEVSNTTASSSGVQVWGSMIVSGGNLTVKNSGKNTTGVFAFGSLSIENSSVLSVANTGTNTGILGNVTIQDSLATISNTNGSSSECVGIYPYALAIDNSTVIMSNDENSAGVLIRSTDVPVLLKNNTHVIAAGEGAGIYFGINSGSLTVDGSILELHSGNGLDLSAPDDVSFTGLNSGTVKLAQGVQVGYINGKMKDQGFVLTQKYVTVGTADTTPSADGLSAGDYVWDGSLFAKGGGSAPVEITGFAEIANLIAGPAGNASYIDTEAVIAVLENYVTANHSGGTVSWPVTIWTDTDGYNPAAEGSYTFTATLGAAPEGYSNSGGHIATIEVVVNAPGGGIPTRASISGTIKGNDTNSGINGATVQLKNTSGDLLAEFTTNSSGQYSFNDLAVGTYSIKASATGYRSGTVSNIVLQTANISGEDIMLTKIRGGGGGDERGGGSSSSGTTLPATVTNHNVDSTGTVNQAAITDEAATVLSGTSQGGTAVVRTQNASSITPVVLGALANEAEGKNIVLHADTMIGNAVQGRIYVDPSKFTDLKEPIKLGVYTESAKTAATTSFFEKFFNNNVATVSFEQQGSIGAMLEIAAKVDLTGMDVTKLVFYSYDKAANVYRRIENPAYWIDKNGYLHFTTQFAGDIIISEGALALKNGGAK